MKALITGASSGLGYDLALKLSKMGYDLVLVSRGRDKLEELKKKCKTNVVIHVYDLTDMENCKKVYEEHKDIDLLINNAGYGLFGESFKTDLDKDMKMIDLNVKALHMLTRLYLKDMVKKDNGRILNVASVAGFMPGPLMNTYYATKSYVYRYTLALYEELRHLKSNVKVSVLCPGPFETNFNNVAGVKFSISSVTSNYVSSYAIKKMFKNKLIILPTLKVKLAYIGRRFVPVKLLMRIDYKMQKRKDDK